MKKKILTTEILIYENSENFTKAEIALIGKAKEAVKRAYAPYSQFRVGAAVLLENGKIVTGNNQENAARLINDMIQSLIEIRDLVDTADQAEMVEMRREKRLCGVKEVDVRWRVLIVISLRFCIFQMFLHSRAPAHDGLSASVATVCPELIERCKLDSAPPSAPRPAGQRPA